MNFKSWRGPLWVYMLLLVSIALGLLLACVARADGVAWAEVYRSEGVRAIWVPGDASDHYADLKAAGFNLLVPYNYLLRRRTPPWPRTVVTPTPGPDDEDIILESDFDPEVMEEARRNAQAAAAADIPLQYNISAVGWEERDLLRMHHYRHLVDLGGHEAPMTPCILERRYWLGLLLPSFRAMARVLQETGADGGCLFEMEAYAAVDWDLYPGYYSFSRPFCFCDYCWDQFLATLSPAERPPELVPSAERFTWLANRGLVHAYYAREGEELREIFAEFVRQVRAIKPDFLFGWYDYGPNWITDAMIETLGTERLPVVLHAFWENPPEREYLQATGLNRLSLEIHWLPPGQFWPKGTALKAAQLLRDYDGFYFYDGLVLVDRAWRKWMVEKPGVVNYEIMVPPEQIADAVTRGIQAARQPRPPGELDSFEGLHYFLPRMSSGVKRIPSGECVTVPLEEPPVPPLVEDFAEETLEATGWEWLGAPYTIAEVEGQRVLRVGTNQIPAQGRMQRRLNLPPGPNYFIEFRARLLNADQPALIWRGTHAAYSTYLPPDREWHWIHNGVMPQSDAGIRFDAPRGIVEITDLRIVVGRNVSFQFGWLPLPAGATWDSVVMDWETDTWAQIEPSIVEPVTNHVLATNLADLAPLSQLWGLEQINVRVNVYLPSDTQFRLRALTINYRQ